MNYSFQELRKLLREFDELASKGQCNFTEEEAKRFQDLIDIFAEYEEFFDDIDNHLPNCPYGQADGPDDYIKECECLEV